MLNYIKSEFYRILHSKEVYVLTAIFTGLITAYNVILYLCQNLPHFQYANTRHSYGMIDMSMGTFIYIIIVICSMLDGSSMKNMKNSVAFGVNRSVIYFGRIIVYSCVCLVMYLYLMGLHFGLGKLLLEDSGSEISQTFIRSTFVCIPMFLGAVVAYHCCILLNKNSITSAAIMIIILVVVPKGMSILAYKISQVKEISDMLMYNLMQVKLTETVTGYARAYTWDTTIGIVKCMIAAVSAIVVFSFIGMRCFQKKEIR
ncbi:hypothetical protein [Roseburia sp. 499]|uniref:hypothetical protein n=1 Tax=Roseburia sp. 499 TaxID=1261634 RepID=UPI000951B9BB|nr:hypothetical protein [Roseburia sp. 499]WVK68785.1 hypothetical protein BIV20_10375 [Roseburia sp. 499]